MTAGGAIAHAPIPNSNAMNGGTPLSTASLGITIEPSAMIVPHAGSIPAVRMINVWPIAITC